MSGDRIAAVARQRLADHLAGARYRSLSGEYRLDDVDQAYAAQRVLLELLEENGRGAVVGYKIAVTSKAIQDLVGIDQPCAAAILAGSVRQSPAELSLGDFVRLGLEFELAVKIGRDMPAATGPYDAASVLDFVDTCMASFELIEDRDADYSDLDAISLIADNGWNGGVVLGSPSPSWRDLDWRATSVSLRYNDEVPETATTGAAMGNPFESLAWMANLMAVQGRPVTAGMIVITGSTLATRYPKAGDTATYEVAGLGSASVTVTD
jgi:2-keto-4-pentenoate hydratase